MPLHLHSWAWIEQLRHGKWQKTRLTKRSEVSSVHLWLCGCYRAWLRTLESCLPPYLSWQDDSILNPSSKIKQSFRIWLKSKLLWSPLSVPFPIPATDSYLLFQGTTDAHAVTQWFSQKLTQKEREIIFHLVQFPKSNLLASPRSNSGGDRMMQTTCAGTHSWTEAALAFNSSRCRRAFTCIS